MTFHEISSTGFIHDVDLHLMSLTLPVSLNTVWKSTILSFLMTKLPSIDGCFDDLSLSTTQIRCFLGHSPFMDYENPNESWLIPEPILNPGLWIQIEFGLNSASYAHHVPRYVYIILIYYIYVCVFHRIVHETNQAVLMDETTCTN